jgi:hypothetical protein
VLITRLPVAEPDLVVGPILVSEPRMLAVPVSHPFASLVSVSVEDLASDKVIDIAGPAPDYWWEAHVPQFTTAGRRGHRGAVVATFQELLTQVAAGQGISPVVESVSRYFPRPDIALIPIRDMPNSEVLACRGRDRPGAGLRRGQLRVQGGGQAGSGHRLSRRSGPRGRRARARRVRAAAGRPKQRVTPAKSPRRPDRRSVGSGPVRSSHPRQPSANRRGPSRSPCVPGGLPGYERNGQ